jgi:hypothetical protein
VTLPIPKTYPPMEAAPAASLPEGSQWQYEPKWDGFGPRTVSWAASAIWRKNPRRLAAPRSIQSRWRTRSRGIPLFDQRGRAAGVNAKIGTAGEAARFHGQSALGGPVDGARNLRPSGNRCARGWSLKCSSTTSLADDFGTGRNCFDGGPTRVPRSAPSTRSCARIDLRWICFEAMKRSRLPPPAGSVVQMLEQVLRRSAWYSSSECLPDLCEFGDRSTGARDGTVHGAVVPRDIGSFSREK